MTRCKSRRNPKTQRCVVMSGKIGRHIIGRPKLCDSILNSRTKRCVLRKASRQNAVASRKKAAAASAKASKKVVESRRKVDRSRAHNQPAESVRGLHEIYLAPTFRGFPPNYIARNDLKGTKLGSGAFGSVYQVVQSGNVKYAMKIQPNNRYAKAEIDAYIKLSNSRVTPKLFAAWTYKNKAYIVMEKVYECREDDLHRVVALADRLEKQGWLHGDLHSGNIMCTSRNRLVFVDFGLAVEKGKAPFKNYFPETRFLDIKKRQEIQLRQLISLVSG